MSARTLTVYSIALAVALVGVVLVPAPAAAAVDAQIICEPLFNGAFCEARPVGSEYSYHWTVTYGALNFPNGCGDSPFCEVGCRSGSGGILEVTVTAPDGSSDSASQYVGCGSY